MTVFGCNPVKSARKAKGDGYLRRAEILSAAERIFVREGYEGATIRRIAEEVGVSSTALYMHFRDKSEMLFEICETAFAGMAALNLGILAQPQDGAVRVRRMLEAYFDFALANPGAFCLVFNRMPDERFAQNAPVAHAMGHRCFALFESAVAELAAAGRLKTPPDVAAQAMWAAVHGLASLQITKSGFGWADTAVLRGALLDGLFHGMLRP